MISSLNKRHRIIIVSFLMAIGFLVVTQTNNILFKRYYYILGFSLASFILSLWALRSEITKLKAAVLLILPVFFSISYASFYYILQLEYIRWATRLPFGIVFGLSFYLLLLSQNVFNVASLKTIPLYRAASTADLMFTLLTTFGLFNVVYTLRLPFYWNGLIVSLISLPLAIHTFWTLNMERVNLQIFIYSFVIAAMLGELTLILSFWPLKPIIWSVSLSAALYVLLGLTTHFLKERFDRGLALEYAGVGVAALVLTFLTTSWAG